MTIVDVVDDGGVVIVEKEERKTRFVKRVVGVCDVDVDDMVLVKQSHRQRQRQREEDVNEDMSGRGSEKKTGTLTGTGFDSSDGDLMV